MSSETRLPKAEDLAPGNWESILIRSNLDKSYFQWDEGPCPVCGGSARFRWRGSDFRRAEYAETGWCNACGLLSPWKILEHSLGAKSFKEMADFIRDWAGYKDDGQARPVREAVAPKARPVPVDDTPRLRAWYQKLWQEASPVAAGTVAETYLRNRVPGLLAVPKCLRAHAGLDYMERTAEGQSQRVGTFPALLAAAQGLDGRVVNIWRTYLGADGLKAPVKEPKKACGKFLQPSYAVRLAEPDDELGVAEGIETALAVMVLYGVPCWSTLNTDGMRKFCLPEGYERVKKIRIFGDNDKPDQRGRRAGNEAAEFLKQKMRDDGRVATVILPKYTTFDFANIAQKEAA